MAVTMTKTTKQINKIVAHLPETRAAVRAAADTLAAIATGELAKHRDTGSSKIVVSKANRVDYYVSLDDSRGAKAAAAIEFGYVAENGRFVPGIHALTGVL